MSDLGDIAFGAVVLAVFLAVVAVAGVLFYRVRNARLSRAWAALVPIVGGRVEGDGGGAASSRLRGGYAGRSVVALMSPMAGQGSRVGNIGTGMAANFFDVALTDVRGRLDWAVTFDPASGWRLETRDPLLERRLLAAGLIERSSGLGAPSPALSVVGLPVLAFTARTTELRLREDAGSAWTPLPDRFRYELDTLVAIAGLNEQLNR